MTNRIDHTNCRHVRTPKARAACRADLAAGGRNRRIAELQRAYMQADAAELPWAEYEAMVDIFSMDFGIKFQDAFELIENGPVIL
jgi:hypothetical protein